MTHYPATKTVANKTEEVMARDWSGREAALKYFQKHRHLDDSGAFDEAINALRRSQDHTAIQNKLNAAMAALKNLVFMVRTSGGTAGHDESLCRACEQAEEVIGQKVPECAKRKADAS